MLFRSNTANGTIAADITLAAGDTGDTNTIAINEVGDDAGSLLTWANEITAAHLIDAIDVGTTTLAGQAKFSSNVDADAISIIGGNVAAEASQIEFLGNVVGATTLDSNTGGATALFSSTSAQTVTGAFIATADDDGILSVTNTHASGLTVNGSIGVTTGNKGIGAIHIASSSKLTQKALVTTAVTFDVTGDIDDGATTAGRGGNLTISAGDATTTEIGRASCRERV